MVRRAAARSLVPRSSDHFFLIGRPSKVLWVLIALHHYATPLVVEFQLPAIPGRTRMTFLISREQYMVLDFFSAHSLASFAHAIIRNDCRAELRNYYETCASPRSA